MKKKLDWRTERLKKEVDKQISEKQKLRGELEVARKRSAEDYKIFQKNFHDMRKTKNFWIWTLALISLLLLISLGVAQNRLSQEKMNNMLMTEAGLNSIVELHKCRSQLDNVTKLYEAGFYEVASNEPRGGLFDCCWPSDCAEAINNPVDCNCEYMVQCSGWN